MTGKFDGQIFSIIVHTKANPLCQVFSSSVNQFVHIFPCKNFTLYIAKLMITASYPANFSIRPTKPIIYYCTLSMWKPMIDYNHCRQIFNPYHKHCYSNRGCKQLLEGMDSTNHSWKSTRCRHPVNSQWEWTLNCRSKGNIISTRNLIKLGSAITHTGAYTHTHNLTKYDCKFHNGSSTYPTAVNIARSTNNCKAEK